MPEFMRVYVVLGCNNNYESWITSIHDNLEGAQKERNRLTEVEHGAGTFIKDEFNIEEWCVTDD